MLYLGGFQYILVVRCVLLRSNSHSFFVLHRVLRGFKFPGAAPLRTETIGFLFDLCSLSPIEGDQ